MSTDVNHVEMYLKNVCLLMKRNQNPTAPVVKVMKHPNLFHCLMPLVCREGAAVVARVVMVAPVVPADYNTPSKRPGLESNFL